MQSSVDVVVVGAGVAGLAAAATLRKAGCTALVLEASKRVGGRAWTVRSPALGDGYFDAGAIWLHSAESNPLTPIAEAAGERLVNADRIGHRHVFVDDRPATSDELADYAGAWDRFETRADALLHPGTANGSLPDDSLAAVARGLLDDPWAVTVETWEGPIICVADAAAFSLRDWQRNVLTGGNILVAGGLGDFVARRLAPPEGLMLDTPVRRVRWQQAGGVAVETPRGTVSARACIVTASTGVLAAGLIGFDPHLPAVVMDSLHGLPMGLALRVVLRAAGADRLGLPDFSSLHRRFERSGEPAIVFNAWQWGFPIVAAWVGGGFAWELARADEPAIEDFVRAELRRMLGARVNRALAPDIAFRSNWGGDEHFLGAYSYARPGQAGARRRLAEPLAGGRLVFAGEATHPTLAGTVGGAWLSGEAAARAAAHAIRR